MLKQSSYDELYVNLLYQFFSDDEDEEVLLAECKKAVHTYVNVEHTLAVLSDLKADKSYVFAGTFGKFFNLAEPYFVIDSAFEDIIFDKIHPDDLIERHVLELRFTKLQKSLPVTERAKYSTVSRLRARNDKGDYIYITHRTLYQKSLSNGSLWLALCIYAPSADQSVQQGINGKIINNENGEVITVNTAQKAEKTLLSLRELELLSLVSAGLSSKQIAGQLNLSVHTVHRHRQNIISKMQVSNIIEAIKAAQNKGLIKA